jgi:hypothetical protein
MMLPQSIDIFRERCSISGKISFKSNLIFRQSSQFLIFRFFWNCIFIIWW